MDTINTWNQIIEQSPLFAFMAIVIYFGGKYIKEQNIKNEKYEFEREARYNILVDKLIQTKSDENVEMIKVITSNTEVMRRVENKLNEH